MPTLINLTILNGQARTSRLLAPPVFVPSNVAHDNLLSFAFDAPASFWPWGGALGVALSAAPLAATFDGAVSGDLQFDLEATDGAHQGTSTSYSQSILCPSLSTALGSSTHPCHMAATSYSQPILCTSLSTTP